MTLNTKVIVETKKRGRKSFLTFLTQLILIINFLWQSRKVKNRLMRSKFNVRKYRSTGI